MNNIKDTKDFWKKVLAEVQLEVTPMVYGTIISRTEVGNIETENDTINVLCEDDFIKKNIEKKYFQIIQEAINKIADRELKLIVAVKKIEKVQTLKENAKDLGPLFQPQQDPEEFAKEKSIKSGLSPKFTFESYIMGKSNQLAFAVANAVADRPGELYNPVFIYSSVGMGKTHLMQAIGNKILKNKPGSKVVYTTSENFTNELVESIQGGKGNGKYTSNDFRNKYRKADALLIDDIQFIAKRESTQEEFFHTFNALYMAQKQIIITSDRPPKDFKGIEERITSRFNSGMIVDVQQPDVEMRMAILRTLRDDRKDPVPNNVLDYIAEMVSSNIRELEGAYLQVLTQANAHGKDMSVDLAASVLGQTVKEKVNKQVNMNSVINAVCTYYSIKTLDLKGQRRTKEFVIPRQVAMYLIKEMTNTPFMTIGEFLGGRDHTTVMHGVEKIGQEIDQHTKIRQDVFNVKQIILND